MPQVGAAGADEAAVEANTDNFFVSFLEPQCGQGVPSHRLERTSNSKSFSQPAQ